MDDTSDDRQGLAWESYLETLLAKWSDHALIYAWLHTQSESKYRALHYWFAIPIIVLSTLGGAMNVGMTSLLPESYVHYGQVGVGCVGIFTGILGTLQNFFKYAQLSESHRNAGMEWHKFHRSVQTELALDLRSRREAGECFRAYKYEMDRLLTNSPYLSEDIVSTYQREHEREIELPDIIGHLHRTSVYRVREEPLEIFGPEVVEPEIPDRE
jgi:hypothetical protein